MTSAVAKTLDDLRNFGSLSGVDVANVASVSKATVSRWSSGKAAPQPATQLILSDLRYVVSRLSEFYSPDEARAWLYARHPRLAGRSAIELINEGDATSVLEVIDSLSDLTYL